MKTVYKLIMLLSGISLSAMAQTTTSLSLKQCIEYANTNSSLVKNASIDMKIADNKKSELSSKVLPQIDGDINYMHNFNVQRIILENGVIPAFSNPGIPYGEVIAFQLQLNNSLTGSINASQVLYDRSLFAGLKATDIGKELSQKGVTKTKVDIAEMVTKAYYGVLVSQKQLEFLTNNLNRLDSLFLETSAKYKLGIVRKIDVDRIEVALNNLKQERGKADRTVLLSKAVLAYQMQFEGSPDFVLADTLSESMLLDASLSAKNNGYENRIEYSILQTQKRLQEVDKNSAKGAYTPKLYAYGTTGYNPAATDASNLFQSSRYYNFTYVGLKLQIPLFHGNEKKYKIGNKTLEDEKLANSIKRAEKMINLEQQQSTISYQKNIESLKIQKRNLDLALENVRVVRVENQKGVATNIEVTNSETDLKEAQNNYYNALYQALISKVDVEKANGVLTN
jgi:outer membrane protein